MAEAPAGRALFEIYDEGLDSPSWGGVATALWHLTRSLREAGVDADFYQESEVADLHALAARVERDRVDAVFPLGESGLFHGARWGSLAELHARTVRARHAVSRLSEDLSTPPACPVHAAAPAVLGAPPADGCPARGAHPDGPMREVFLRALPWTRCFPHRSVIPRATDHGPAKDLHDPFGPVVLQLGKIDTVDAERCLSRLTGNGVPLRVMFATWSRHGREARELVRAHQGTGRRIEVLDVYDIRTDRERVFGGAALFLVPSVFHETFNFAATEAVQLGVPVATLAKGGNLPRFASLCAPALDELLDRVVTDGRILARRPRLPAGWREVPARCAEIIRSQPAGGGRDGRHDG
uniref:Putative glycosyltransferase n=1 Tax=Streptomyces ribosidificus TaxID=80859 RepID=Q2MFC4_STRRI|nr:putative glycosyltransferase [Streptomyces ribosidificus]